LLIQAIDDVFGFTRGKTLDDVRAKISGEQVKDLYSIIANIWDFRTDIYKLLPEAKENLHAIYLGDVFPDMIIKNVIRFSLYTDKIYVINPFLNPWTIRKEFNPLHIPEQFKADTIKLIVFMGLLEPWIKAGIVDLIPYPGDFDYSLNMECFRLAEERYKTIELSEEDIKEYEPYAFSDLQRFISNLPDEALIQHIKNTSPFIDDNEIKNVVEYIHEQRKNDPLSLNQTFSGKEKVGQFNLMRSGANLEMALYLSQLTGAFPLNSSDSFNETSKLWTPLTKAFQKLEFNFLDNVDVKFIEKLKETNRLGSFRNFIRKVWLSIEGTLDSNKIESLSRGFCDELKDEYQKASAEWKSINTEIVSWAGYTASTVLISSAFGKISTFNETGSIISGNIALGLGLGVASVSKLLEKYSKRKSFRQTVPMSVFVDLSKKAK
jgi:hypothetical protein